MCKKLREDKVQHHTRDGKVFMSVGENEFKVLDSPTDWEELNWTDRVKTDIGIYPRD